VPSLNLYYCEQTVPCSQPGNGPSPERYVRISGSQLISNFVTSSIH
jgi:hypothetical protein